MSKPYKHIAVVLRGHIRTWHHICEYNFKFYDELADNVDYYLSTWDLPNYDKNKIIKSFEGKNLIKAIFLSTETEYYQANSLSCGWQTTQLIPYKTERERSVTYDAIFETRPDVTYSITHPHLVDSIHESTHYSIRPKEVDTHLGPSIFLEDYFFIMNSRCFDTISPRYFEKDTYCNAQITISNVILSRGFQIHNITWAETCIVRPSILEHISDSTDLFDKNTKSPKFNCSTWTSLSNDEKLRLCQKYEIDPEDYRCSGSNLIKIH